MLQACSWQLGHLPCCSDYRNPKLQSEMQLLPFGQCNLFASEERTMSGEAERPTSSDDGRSQLDNSLLVAGRSSPAVALVAAISRRAGYFAVGLAAFCVVVEFRAHSGLLGVRGPDAYWALHWNRDYSSGFIRRGLLGEVLRALGVDTTDYLIITFLAWSYLARAGASS